MKCSQCGGVALYEAAADESEGFVALCADCAVNVLCGSGRISLRAFQGIGGSLTVGVIESDMADSVQ